MFIKLTNASEGFEGLRIAVNSDVIVSVFERNIAPEGERKKVRTHVYAKDNMTWQVKESLEEVVALLN